MPIEQVAQSLGFINWTLLAALAVGSFAAVVAARFRTEATKGYLGFTAFSAAAFAALAHLSDGGISTGAGDGFHSIAIDPAWETPRRLALAALAALSLGYSVALFRGRRAVPVAAAGLAAAAAVLITAGLSWGGGGLASALLALELGALSIGLGGVWAAMILGHWYLVTPKLPEAPLVRVARWLGLGLVLQLTLFAAWIGFGAGPRGTPAFAALVGPWALLVWLRLLVGLVFPLIVTWAAVQTARSRSMESATGLLYINVGTIAVGTILAAGLYFGAGVLV
ncbi:MAG TPA: hypothetical protein VM451_02445 [Candidatus Limnocylindria bacterium]|nr:hypothetical protein [Candidatus Limnocylindria bacterium]